MALSMIFMIQGCATKRRMITTNGIHAMKLGEKLPAIGTPSLKGHALRDTFVDEGEFSWRQAVMEYKKGNVYIEEDFFGSGQVGRIRIYTPELSLRNGLRVGMAASDLKTKANDWTVIPMADYNVLDLYSRIFPRIHFIVDDPAVSKEGSWEEYNIDQVNDTAKIVAIVVL